MTIATKWKFPGTKVYISTGVLGVSPSPPITGISLTDPAIVTAPAHGLVAGDVALLSGILGATQFNDKMYVVDNSTTNDFDLSGEDNTNGDAYTSGGRVDEVSFTRSCQLTGISKQGAGADQIDASTVCDDEFKRFVQGISDTGTLTLDYLYDPLNTAQAALDAAEASGAEIAIKLVEKLDSWTLIMFGTVQSTNWAGSMGDPLYKGSATIKLSGPVFLV
jgi:hypothetical protein